MKIAVEVVVTDAEQMGVTDLAASIVTEQEPAPVQAPLQPEKDDPASGIANPSRASRNPDLTGTAGSRPA